MRDNQLPKTLFLALIVTGILFLLSFFPPLSVGSTKLRKINLLADIEKDKPKPIVTEKTPKKAKPKPIAKSTGCPKGITCIEDYSENKKALAPFFRSLKQTKNKPVRIAFFGDSFIEGDILTASFRDTLQSLFGGHGVGYVPATSEVAQFRTTIEHKFSNWKTYSFVGKKSPYSPLATPGYCFVPQEENELLFKPGRKKSNNYFSTVRVFYKSTLTDTVNYTINDTLHYSMPLLASDSLSEISIKANKAKSIQFTFNPSDSLKIYGLSFDDDKGIYVDNLSMRGNSGMGLLQVSRSMHEQFNIYQKYKLIILQYGLNVVSENDSLGYDWYTQRMVRAVNNLKESFPESSILIVSVSDRSSNQDGKFATIPSMPVMRDAQREIARQCKVAFWDLFTAMGGENSMIKFVEAKPPLAAKDYTHLTFQGGRRLAKMLADALLHERKEYEKNKKI
jgi:lysophospholipase L1-like esterase